MAVHAGRALFEQGIGDRRGNAQRGVLVWVYDRGTSTLSTLYTDRTKATVQDNPLSTNGLGNLSIFADPGDYEAHVDSTGAVLEFTVLPDWEDVVTDDEPEGGLPAHLADAVDAHDASAVSFVPTGSVAATTVQAAIVEVVTDAASDLLAEATTRAAADSTLTTGLAAEATARTAADTAEATARASADTTEATARAAADTAEATARAAADATLTTNVATNTAAIATETTRATTAEGLKLAKASNLSDVANAANALANLGGQASIPPGTYVQYLPAPGGVDDTALIQAAHDALPADGGTILPRPGAEYVVGRVNITKPNVTVDMNSATFFRKAGMSSTDRGMFTLLALLDANFRITGTGAIDLNRSAYANGASNSAIHALRCSHIYVDHGITIRNSSECAVLARSCGHVSVNATIENCWNNGFEVSLPPPGSDTSSIYGITGAPVPTPEWFEADIRCSDVDNNSFGAGDGCGFAIGCTATNTVVRHVRVKGLFARNARDVHLELNGAGGSYAQDVKIDVQSDSPKSGSVGLVHVKDAEVDVTVRNPGVAGTRGLGNDIYGIVVSGSLSDRVTLSVDCFDDRASAVDYTTNAIIISGGVDIMVKRATVNFAANVGQTVAPIAVDIRSISGTVLLGELDLDITNPPASTIGVRHSSGFAYLSSPYSMSGWATNFSLSGNAWNGMADSVAIPTGNVIMRTNARGMLTDTADGADTKSVLLCGGGAFADGRGALVSLYGNENGGAPGRLDLRAGSATGAYVTVQAIGQEVARLVGQASIADGSTALMIRRNVGGTFTLQQVSMGAADSGGAGFKVLRVAN